MWRKVAQTLRILVGVGLLAWLLKRVDLGSLWSNIAESMAHPEWLMAGLFAMFAGLVSGVVRWKILLQSQGLKLSGWEVFRIFFVGLFFNAFMPGACGGDVARAFFVVKVTGKGRRAEAASTVFIDRAIGLFATILFCCAVIIVRLPFMFRQSETQLPGLLMLGFLAISCLALFVLLRRNLFEEWKVFRRLENSGTIGKLIRRAYETAYLYRSQPGVLVATGLLSFLNLFCLTLACFYFGKSLDIPLGWPAYFTFFPIITVISAIPLTPGALGIRENLFVAMFGVLGVPPAEALSLSILNYAAGLAWGVLGGVLFISYSSREYQALKKEIESSAGS